MRSSITGGRGYARGGSWRQRGGATPTESAETPTTSKPQLTHFLAIPIGHHAALRTEMQKFSASLLSTQPLINGLHESIIIPGRRLHFTLGGMSLETPGPEAEGSDRPTLDAAISFLHDLKPKIDQILLGPSSPSSSSEPFAATPGLKVTLDTMDAMKLEKNEMAHVVWVGPEGCNSKNITDWQTKRLRDVSDFVHNAFKTAGFVVDEKRPLKLHCTILNTIHRKPKPRGGRRVPFSYRALLDAPFFSSERAEGPTSSPVPTFNSEVQGSEPTKLRTLRAVNFGTYSIDEIQICEMGSHGPEGEYVAVGSIPLIHDAVKK